ncbi:Phosphomannomutase OS=Streptomyces albaduncus OX=68172 GN=FHS32_006215 PE=3 SV=1 [Streptomyces griseoloalbus]
MAADLSQIVKAYDVRGVVPDQWDEPLAELFGAAFVRVTAATAVVTGHDMRPSSPGLSAAFARGAAGQGADVTEIGLCSTDQLYYASGALDLPGAMFTASHNPARYNGIKLCRAGAAPVGQDTGLADIRALVEEWTTTGAPEPAAATGTVTRRDTLEDYAAHLRSLVDVTGIRPLKVVVDAGNGMGGHTVPTVLAGLPLTVVPLYFELDGTFPNHEANPLDPANLVDLQKRVREEGADLGLAFDGDADRCFVVDERGEPVSPSAVTALVASRELARNGGKGTVIHNLITSRSVPEVVREHGGTPRAHPRGPLLHQGGDGQDRRHLRRRALRPLLLPRLLERRHRHAGRPARPRRARRAAGHPSAVVAAYDRYAGSGEINSTVDDQAARLAAIRAAYEGREGVDPRRAGRPHRLRRRLVVQRPPQQHRTAASG